ncbi:MAG: DUF5596 domain-containing protein [Clostridia bacterium]|nr:DUF5596 domain-containing protein [Clostridia bacterium]
MRTYLTEFFRDFDYARADADVLLAVYDRIAENAETAACWREMIAAYEADLNCDYDSLIKQADEIAERLYLHECTLELLLFICLSRHTKALYIERGLDLEIYHNSMLDLKYKLEECKAVRGIVGSFVAKWFPRFFGLTRFALGRLQFELIDFGFRYEKDGKVLTPESKVINVHIPRTGTPIDQESCDAAYAQAKAFFADQIDGPIAFYCSSWMLYPENKQILSPKSNTYRFMMQYDILESGIDKNFSNLWRLFDTDEKRWDRLPTDSFMRRAYVEHLKKGGKLGWGKGVFFAGDGRICTKI